MNISDTMKTLKNKEMKKLIAVIAILSIGIFLILVLKQNSNNDCPINCTQYLK